MSVAAKRVSVLISGRGSNMTALARTAAEETYPAEIAGVISDREDAPGLDAAAAAGIPAVAVPRPAFCDKSAHEAAIEKTLGEQGAELICLAGFMRLLSEDFVERWQGRMINIHPSLLPLFPGLDTHARALEAGMRIHGATVHFVTPKMDSGPVIAQAAVPVLPNDTQEALAGRVLKAEHQVYPLALALVASGRARMEGGRTVFSEDGEIGWGAQTSLLSPSSVAAALDPQDRAGRTR